MIIAVLSDIHGNREALAVVLGQISRLSVDSVYCLGDIVGYNADPDFCLQELIPRCEFLVRGNHDKATAGNLSLEWFNPAAEKAVLWTRGAMRPANLQKLERLKAGPLEAGGGILLCHGTPMDEDAYMWGGPLMVDTFQYLAKHHPETRVCFHGHTHIPLIAERRERKASTVSEEREISLDPHGTYLINPGSVGQPRDGNSRASFGILDTERSVYRNLRLRYDVQETQRKILAAGLPRDLSRRLAEGR